jgi:gliding motility-associated-like protein
VKLQSFFSFLVVALFWCSLSQAQTADFTADKYAGCPSLTVKFTNASTGSGLTYAWDFGNNGGTSIEKDPTAIFVSSGTYTVTLTVKQGTVTVSKSKTIQVYKPPTADFKADQTKGCIPLTAKFTDLSVKGDGTINKWTWDYRNGTISNMQVPNPVVYSTQGKYSIYLKVTDNNGCFDEEEKVNYIDAATSPKPSFTPSPSKSCQIPQVVTFTNTSTGSADANLTYLWDFGNSDQQSTKTPSTTYKNYGDYYVSLTVNDNYYNCTNTTGYTAVSIAPIDAIGTIKQGTTTINSNDTICAGTLTFTNQSTGSTNAYWNFGDGSSSYLPNTTHTYNTKGKYTVSLIASATGAKCTDTVKWVINVEKVTANFSFDPATSCTSPSAVTFTNTSTDATSYKWTFHDNSTTSETNPKFSYIIKPDKDPYVIHSEETYPIILTAYSQHQCENKITKYFKVNLPTALYSVDKSEGCAPLTVTFTDKSTPLAKIITRKWLFGDNTEQLVSASTPIKHIYTNAGTYISKLVVTDATGCVDTSYSITITAGKKPQPNFEVTTPTSFYSDQLVTLADKTPASDNVDYWNYSINGTSIATCPNIKDPSFYFNTDTGKLSVTLLAGSNGCFEDTVFPNLIVCLGPVGSFSYNMDCLTPLKYTFTGIAKGATSFEWDFGDGSAKNTTTLTPEHTYTLAGDYPVKLVTQNNGHYHTVSAIVSVRKPNAQFTAKTSTCINKKVKFNSLASHPIYTTCRDKYEWNFGDGSPSLLTNNDSIDYTFAKRGEFDVTLTALYENGCTSSLTQKIRVFAPYASIKTDTTSGCNNLKVAFTDMSGADNSSLVKWYWNFANGTDSTLTAGGHKINKQFDLPSGVKSYEFPVALSVTDNSGCVGTDTANIRISTPSANFDATSLTQLCYADTAKFARYFTEADSVIWYFGDGSISRSNANPISHLYKNQGNYNQSLKVYKYHCSDSTTKSQGYIQVQKADAHYTISDSIVNCTKEIKFKHTGNMSPVDSGKWYFGHGGNTGTYDTVKYYNYAMPGTFTTKLMVYTSFGCADTFERKIKVFAPYADFATTPLSACKGDSVRFELRDTANVHNWEWNFGEGIAFYNLNPVKYAFSSVGKKPVTLIVYKDSECKYTAPKYFPVEEVTAKIGVTDTSACANENIKFTNLSTGQTSFTWDMGNGTTFKDINEIDQTYTANTYYVKLMVQNDNECKDTAIQTILINPIPKISLSNDTVLCRGSSLILHASGGNVIKWSPGKWLSDATIYHPTTTADSTIKYQVEVLVDTTICSAKDSVLVTVQQKPDFTLVPARDTAIFIGDELSMIITANETYNYSWTPQTYLLCNADCSNALVKPEDTISYVLSVKDVNNCFTDNRKIKITIKDTCLFDVANAFTPNGDEKNRILKVEGKGIKELIGFKIYNRWGNVVFETTDIAKGWDGNTNGKAQPIDTYIYTVTIKTYKGFILSKKGSVLLIR